MTTSSHTLEIRRANDRGATDLGWLHSRHSFSFGRYRDPERMAFRALRVLNDDVIAPGGGFGEHGHENMEIISWVLEGALEHADSTGHRGRIVPGDVQVMSAGHGIRHSEMNGLDDRQTRLLQIWIEPAQVDVEPRYQQTRFDAAGRANQWQLVVSPDGRAGSLPIHQDASLAIANLSSGAALDRATTADRYGYLHVATGRVVVDGHTLHAGDAVTWSGQRAWTIAAEADSQLLAFDLG